MDGEGTAQDFYRLESFYRERDCTPTLDFFPLAHPSLRVAFRSDLRPPAQAFSEGCDLATVSTLPGSASQANYITNATRRAAVNDSDFMSFIPK